MQWFNSPKMLDFHPLLPRAAHPQSPILDMFNFQLPNFNFSSKQVRQNLRPSFLQTFTKMAFIRVVNLIHQKANIAI
jgi:hypothetical protein